MPRRAPQLAKLTRPRIPKVVQRERLFTALDGNGDGGAVWVEGPPGAGKTTLVSSWLEARKRPAIWIQVDDGDTDPAAFFLYLGAAVRSLAPRARLPLYERDYQHDALGFARRFFRLMFAHLPQRGVLVLDNLHELGASAVAELVPTMADEVPPGVTLVLTSRTQAPAQWSRHLANDTVRVVSAEALRLTAPETAEVALTAGHLNADQVAHVQRESGGWAAGVRLMVEALRRGSDTGANDHASVRETLFDYFATQVFDRAGAATQRLLTCTALLPRFDAAMAKAISDIEGAAEILDRLFRSRWFTERRGGPLYTYEFHALFRTFLLARLRACTAPEVLRNLESKAARLMREAGYHGESFHLHRDACDWAQCVGIVLDQAEVLIDQGRWRTLLDWLNAIPAAFRDDDLRLQYWRGMALMSTDLDTARAVLTCAREGFARASDRTGESMCAAGLLEGFFYEYDDLTPVDDALETITSALSQGARYPSASAELAVCSAALIGLVFRRPGDRALSAVIQRVARLLEQKLDVNRRLAAAQFLLYACYAGGDFAHGDSLATEVEALTQDESASEIVRYLAYDALVSYLFISGHYARAEKALLRAIALGNQLPQPTLQVDLWMLGCFLAVQERDVAKAERCLAHIASSATDERRSDRQFEWVARAWVAATRGDALAAASAASEAARIADARQVGFWQLICRLPLVYALLLARKHDNARLALQEADAILQQSPLGYPDTALRALRAVLVVRTRGAAARQELCELFRTVAQREHGAILNRFQLLMPELAAAALAMDVETSTVRWLIVRFGWPSPSFAAKRWPWAICVRALGGFSVECEGVPLKFSGKAPRRVLEVLKVLIAFGGRDVHRRQLVDALWPDEDGDAGYAALEVAVARLRKLLGSPHCVVVRNEQLSLDFTRTWVDCYALEEAIDADMDAGERGDRMLALYKGDFLPSDSEAPWSVRPRLRLRACFIRGVLATARHHEQKGDWQAALGLYERALDIDDLAEPFYQGFMRCCLTLDRITDGMRAYRRMRQSLSVALGIAPSNDSQTLARALTDARSAPSSSS